MHDDDLLMNHFWWRPGWRPGRAYLTWHVLPDDDVARAVAPLQESLRSLEHLAVVRPERLHVTGPGVGFADEVGVNVVPALLDAAAVRLRDCGPFDTTFDAPVTGRNAVLLPVRADGLGGLRLALRHAVRDLGLEPPGRDDEGYRPHLTLAYATGPASRSAVGEALADVDTSDLPVLHVTAASLLALVMEPPGYDWTVAGTVPLGAPARQHSRGSSRDGRKSPGERSTAP